MGKEGGRERSGGPRGLRQVSSSVEFGHCCSPIPSHYSSRTDFEDSKAASVKGRERSGLLLASPPGPGLSVLPVSRTDGTGGDESLEMGDAGSAPFLQPHFSF